ncbi:MAG: TetR/AcrR family transcriptional regulator, partial [Bacteroidota bacterium]
RWGYDKTTIDDIAKKAGVAKGTIYLHWKTREELFDALMRREAAALSTDYRQRIVSDPKGATLLGIYRNAALALIQRPLLKAFLLRERDIIGKMAHVEQQSPEYGERLSGFEIYLGFLSDHGLLRSDINARTQVYIVTAIFMGFFLIEPLVPTELRLSDDEMAEMIGEAIHRTLESGRRIGEKEMKTVSTAFLTYLDKINAHTK